MATEKHANSPTPSTPSTAWATITAAINASETALALSTLSSFPAAVQFRILIDNELMLVTALPGGLAATVTRGVESTTAAVHSSGASVYHVLSAAALARSPRSMTTLGDLEYLDSNGSPARLGVGTVGHVLTVAGGLPSWASPISLATQTANTIFAGPTSGGVAAPTFRAMVTADLGTTLTPTFAGVTFASGNGLSLESFGYAPTTIKGGVYNQLGSESNAVFIDNPTDGYVAFIFQPYTDLIGRGQINFYGDAAAGGTSFGSTLGVNPGIGNDGGDGRVFGGNGSASNGGDVFVGGGKGAVPGVAYLHDGTNQGLELEGNGVGYFPVGVRTAASAEFLEMTPQGVAAANTARLYADDSGGKTRLMVIFQSGAAIQLAIEV